MKKFFMTLVGVLIVLSSSAHAHRWQWAAYVSESTAVYIDTDSAVSIQELFALNEPCIQALFKRNDFIYVINFRKQNGILYVASDIVDSEVVNLLSMTEAQEREKRYKELRSQGAKPDKAGSIVAEERDKIRDKLRQQYADGLATYGKNPDGSINPTGAAILCLMVPLDKQGALTLAQSFGFNGNYTVVQPGSLQMNLYTVAMRAVANKSH